MWSAASTRACRANSEPVWQAIYDHYKPESMEDAIPRHRTAQIVALADKLDTLRGCFGVGLDSHRIARPLRAAPRRAGRRQHPDRRHASTFLCSICIGDDEALRAFFAERVRYYFKDIRGFAYDEINAVHGRQLGWGNLVDLEARLERVRGLRASPDFEPLAAASNASRTSWIRPGKGLHAPPSGIDEALLEAGPERELYQEFRRIAGQPIENVISRLRPKIDLFFDKVLVNAPDPAVRQNRLTLLQTLLAEFSTIADFSEIVTNS